MLGAYNAKGKHIVPAMMTFDEIDRLRREVFYCPDCKDEVIIRAGPKVIPHFAHKRDSNCSMKENSGESEYHYKAKFLLYDWLKSQQLRPQLEKFIPQINQRPDVYVETTNRKIAIEFQRSSLSSKIISDRNKGYEKANIFPVWMVGFNQLKRLSTYNFRTTSFINHFLIHFSSNFPSLLIYFCPDKKEFTILSDLHYVTATRVFAYPVVRRLQDITLRQLFIQSFFPHRQLLPLWQNEKSRLRLYSKLVRGRELRFRQWLYSNNLYVEQLPSIIHLPIRFQYKMNVPTWHWQSLLILQLIHPLKIGSTFSVNNCSQVISPYVIRKYRHPPHINQVVFEYVKYLEQLQIVKRLNSLHWQKLRSVQFYRYVEDALRGDEQIINMLIRIAEGVRN